MKTPPDRVVITESRPNEVLEALHQSAHAEREYLFAARDPELGDLVLVAWLGSQAVGYIAVTDEREQGLLIWEHVVVPLYRRRGIGEMLLVEAVRRAVPGAMVYVDPLAELDLDRTEDYYRQLGFARSATKGGIRATAVDVLRASRRKSTADESSISLQSILDSKAPGVITINPADSVRDAVALLHQHRIGALVASSDGSRIEGILSERDVMVGLAQHGADVLDRPVSEAHTSDVITCTASDSVATAMDLMTLCKVRHLPVTDTGQLVGLVSLGDIVVSRLRTMEYIDGTLEDSE